MDKRVSMYIVVNSKDIISFTNDVNGYIRKGYQLYGELQILKKEHCVIYHQVMVKYQETKNVIGNN